MKMIKNTEISVSTLTQKITKLLRDGIGEVRVLGEISGYKAASSGHRYFTLKDDESQIDCVLWSSKQISFMPSDPNYTHLFADKFITGIF